MNFIGREIRRFKRLSVYSKNYKNYFFDNLMFVINAYMKVFSREIEASANLENQDQNIEN